jgi:ribosomal protein S18 acetylase RimI-like enzyme
VKVALIDPSSRLDEVVLLLARSHGSPSSVRRALEQYRSRSWRMLGYEADGAVVALLGFERTSVGEVVIRTLAVLESYRGRGLGRALIRELAERFPDAALAAETDASAVGFYRRCGFRIKSLGEQYPGVQRFRCVKAGAGTASGPAPAALGP